MASHHVRTQSGRGGKIAAISAPDETIPYLASVAAGARAEGLPPEAVKARVNKFVELAQSKRDELKRVHDECTALEADADAELRKASEAYAAHGTFANAQLLELAKSARNRVYADCRQRRRATAHAVERVENSARAEAALAGHINNLRGFLAGEPVDTTYRSNVDSYENPTADVCRWLVNAPAGVSVVLAKEAIESGALPHNERVAEVRAAYLRADEYRLACNRDRNALPYITYGIKTVQLEIDQVSTEELDAKCAELGRVPTNEEIRAMFRGPGKDEVYKAKVAADEEARRNSPATKKLQQSVQELLARGRSTKV